MKLSLIIPYVPLVETDALLQHNLKSLAGYDELLLVLNDWKGFAVPVNQGLRLAHGEYLAVVNADIEITKGSLLDLCKPEGVCSPLYNGQRPEVAGKPWSHLWGALFVIPRWGYEQIGGIDEEYPFYFEDDDFMMRLQAAGIPMICEENVDTFSEGDRTMIHNPERQALYNKGKDIFYRKWQNHPLYQS